MAAARRQAFEAEVLPHLDAAYRLALVLTGHAADAEDLVQEACLRAFAGFAGYQRGTNARAWLLTIVRRVYLNDRRRTRTHPAPLRLDDDPGPTAPWGGQTALWIALQTPGPEAQMLCALDRAAVWAAVAALPEVFRVAVVLVDLEGLRYAEAARLLACPLGTVMSRVHRGRALLARALRTTIAAERVLADPAPARAAARAAPLQARCEEAP